MVKILKSPGLYIDCKDHWKVGEKCGTSVKDETNTWSSSFFKYTNYRTGIKNFFDIQPGAAQC